jgi:hypothetical protein
MGQTKSLSGNEAIEKIQELAGYGSSVIKTVRRTARSILMIQCT